MPKNRICKGLTCHSTCGTVELLMMGKMLNHIFVPRNDALSGAVHLGELTVLFPVLVLGSWHQNMNLPCSGVHQLLLLIPLKMSEPTSDITACCQGNGFAVAKQGL